MNTKDTWFRARFHETGQVFPVHKMEDMRFGVTVVGHTPDKGGWYDRHKGDVGKKKRHLQIKLNPENPQVKKFMETLEAEVKDYSKVYDSEFGNGVGWALDKFVEMLVGWEETEHGNRTEMEP